MIGDAAAPAGITVGMAKIPQEHSFVELRLCGSGRCASIRKTSIATPAMAGILRTELCGLTPSIGADAADDGGDGRRGS